MPLDLRADLYEACRQISPRNPDYATLPGSLPFLAAAGGGSRSPARARRPRLRGGPYVGRPPLLLQRPRERAGRVLIVLPLGDARAGQGGRRRRFAPVRRWPQCTDVPLL